MRCGLDISETAVSVAVYEYSDSISYSAWTPEIAVEMKLPHDALHGVWRTS